MQLNCFSSTVERNFKMYRNANINKKSDKRAFCDYAVFESTQNWCLKNGKLLLRNAERYYRWSLRNNYFLNHFWNVAAKTTPQFQCNAGSTFVQDAKATCCEQRLNDRSKHMACIKLAWHPQKIRSIFRVPSETKTGKNSFYWSLGCVFFQCLLKVLMSQWLTPFKYLVRTIV